MREQMQVMSQLFANQLEALRGISAEQSGAKTQNELPHPRQRLPKAPSLPLRRRVPRPLLAPSQMPPRNRPNSSLLGRTNRRKRQKEPRLNSRKLSRNISKR